MHDVKSCSLLLCNEDLQHNCSLQCTQAIEKLREISEPDVSTTVALGPLGVTQEMDGNGVLVLHFGDNSANSMKCAEYTELKAKFNCTTKKPTWRQTAGFPVRDSQASFSSFTF